MEKRLVLCYNTQYIPYDYMRFFMLSLLHPSLPVAAPEILVPARDVNLYRWAVIACDQFTSEPEYWSDVDRIVGDAPSALRMVLPEVFLESLSEAEIDKEIAEINKAIDHYLMEDRLHKLPPGFILLTRSTPHTPSRKGLMLALDLERYDFTPGTKEPIRATEGTVLSRIPPRARIRKDAALELPHIMVLIDDPDRTVIEPAFALLSKGEPIYDTALMQDGGHVKGFFCDAASDIAQSITDALRVLFARSGDGFLFAVGDGNHSLATAKAHWEAVRQTLEPIEREGHPARFSLVEAVNIHDDGLDFEPIHRIAFGLSVDAFREKAAKFYIDCGFDFRPASEYDSFNSSAPIQEILVTDGAGDYMMTLTAPPHSLAVGSLQAFLDETADRDPAIRIDYIHGDITVSKLAGPDATGFILPGVSKHSFFQTVSETGVFPRKTFSMGHAQEKRYYLEAKMITEIRKGGN